MTAVVAVGIGTLAGVAAVADLVGTTRSAVRARRRLPRRSDRLAPAPSRYRRLDTALIGADVDLAPTAALRLAGLMTLAAGLAGSVIGGRSLGLVAAVAAAASGPVALLALAGRRDRRADAGLPVVLDDVARALRAGAAPGEAVVAAADGVGMAASRAEMRAVVDDLRAGLGLVEALERWDERRSSRPVRLVVAALAIGSSTGGTRSEAVEAVGATLRERQAVAREAAALATQARSSAAVIALAPLGFAVLAALSDPRAGTFLVGSPVGLGCFAGGLVLDGIGAWWMHRIVAVA